MNAAETSASSAIAPCTSLTVVSRSSTTLAIDTFISDVSTTSTNIAIASSTARRWLPPPQEVSSELTGARVAPPAPCGITPFGLRDPALGERGDLQLVRCGLRALLGQELDRLRELVGVGERGRVDPLARADQRLDARVDDQQCDVDAALAQLLRGRQRDRAHATRAG